MEARDGTVDAVEPVVSVLRTPAGAAVKIVERGGGTPVVFLHSGVGSAGEWRGVFQLWPEGHRLVAVDAYGAGPGPAGRRSLDDYADWHAASSFGPFDDRWYALPSIDPAMDRFHADHVAEIWEPAS